MKFQRNSKSFLIAKQYKILLLQKKLKAGTRVGSVRKLMEMYHVSASTADKVLRCLTEEGVLYRIPSRGTYIKNDPREELHLGFTSRNSLSPNASEFKKMTIRALKKTLREQNIDPYYISYKTLQDPKLAEEAFSGINALLLNDGYADAKTIPQLSRFTGPIVLIGSLHPVNCLPINQVMPDYESALLELEPDIRKFQRIIIFTGGHPNALRQEDLIRKILSGMKIDAVELGYGEPYANAYRYFRKHRSGYENTLLIMLSGWFSSALRDAFGTDPLPQTLEFDNWESSLADPIHNSIFTAVDPLLTDCYDTAIALLKKLVEEKDPNRHIVMLKPRIIVRKSFIPKIYLQNKQERV